MKNIQTYLLISWAIIATLFAAFQTYQVTYKDEEIQMQIEMTERNAEIAKDLQVEAARQREIALKASQIAEKEKEILELQLAACKDGQ